MSHDNLNDFYIYATQYEPRSASMRKCVKIKDLTSVISFIKKIPRRTSQEHATTCKVGGAPYARSEIGSIRETLDSEEIGQVHFRELFAPDVSRILLLGIGLAVLQQWCGINVIFNYAQEVFAAAGYSISGIMQSIVITG